MESKDGTQSESQIRSSEIVGRRVAKPHFKWRDGYGWPLEMIIGRPVTNVIRVILHADIRRSWKLRNHCD